MVDRCLAVEDDWIIHLIRHEEASRYMHTPTPG
jgi:hypothetical protein